jgi:hypothetical protein
MQSTTTEISQDQANDLALQSLGYLQKIKELYQQAGLEISYILNKETVSYFQFVEAYRRLWDLSFMFAENPSHKNRQRLEQAYSEVSRLHHAVDFWQREKGKDPL